MEIKVIEIDLKRKKEIIFEERLREKTSSKNKNISVSKILKSLSLILRFIKIL